MANRFTRVPETPPPVLPPWTTPMVVIADYFMILMISRPKSGSLRQTWITPSTAWLAGFVVVLGTPVTGILAYLSLETGNLVPIIGAVCGLLGVAGCTAICIIAIAQLRGLRTSTR